MDLSSLVDLREGAEEVDGGAAFIGVADELSVQLLVASEGDASSLLVVILSETSNLVILNFRGLYKIHGISFLLRKLKLSRFMKKKKKKSKFALI